MLPLPQADTVVQALAEDVAFYKRAKCLGDNSDYSFEFLFEAANRYLRTTRENAMQEALSRGLMGCPTGLRLESTLNLK